jgi:hypothetical protein
LYRVEVVEMVASKATKAITFKVQANGERIVEPSMRYNV